MLHQSKPNVTVLASTIIRKVTIENGVAVGVLAESEDGIMRIFKAKKEVAVASGVFESPKLLMLSGVGPKKTLESHEIDVVVDSRMSDKI